MRMALKEKYFFSRLLIIKKVVIENINIIPDSLVNNRHDAAIM